ncbi:MAG: antirestriction protein ArdA, partial [Ruminococcaceae bacterium]|nr:antirestriction protein ArdA [Oscillospiraceae bacterium]
DVVVLHQDGDVSAHYVDSVGFREVPQFLDRDKAQVLIPDEYTTGETITTPRGSFSVTDMTREQMEAAGYGVHHMSDDGKHLIMGNGTQAFAVAVEQPTVNALEAKAGEPISLADPPNAIKSEERGEKGNPKEEKQSIRSQLKKDTGKEKAAPKKAATKKKNNDLEV